MSETKSFCMMIHFQDETILQKAAAELEKFRNVPKHDGLPFPRNCRRLLFQIPGNFSCVDCGHANPEWASVTFGVLLCVNCSGRHRSYGVSTSFVRSIDMDAWSHEQVLSLLEGGNKQMKQFFQRHHMHGESTSALDTQYKTKAAKFYKTNLTAHVNRVAEAGRYTGREAARHNRSPKALPQRNPLQATNDASERNMSRQSAIAAR